MISTEVLCAATSELGNSSNYSVCALGSDVERCLYVQSCMMVQKDIEIQPGFEPGSSEF